MTIKNDLETTGNRKADLLKLGGVIQNVFFMVVVLAIDLCFNKTEATRDDRKSAAIAAVGSVESSKEQSLIANKHLESLMDYLRKRKDGSRSADVGVASATGTWPDYRAIQAPAALSATEWNYASNMATTNYADCSFEDIWGECIDQVADFDAAEWGRLFAALECP